MAILAERFVHVIGVDTHKLTLTAAGVNNVGGVLESCECRPTPLETDSSWLWLLDIPVLCFGQSKAPDPTEVP